MEEDPADQVATTSNGFNPSETAENAGSYQQLMEKYSFQQKELEKLAISSIFWVKKAVFPDVKSKTQSIERNC